MKMFNFLAVSLSLIVGVFTGASAVAKDLDLTLHQKIQGAPEWDCPPQLILQRTPSEIVLVSVPHAKESFYLAIENINKGTICSKLNSSYIFGGVRCANSTLIESFSAATAEKWTCTREWGSFSCDPMKQPASEFIGVDKVKKKVLFRHTTGWQDYTHFSCEYKY